MKETLSEEVINKLFSNVGRTFVIAFEKEVFHMPTITYGKNNWQFGICPTPTSNCQVSSIAAFADLYDAIENYTDVLKKVGEKVGKKLMLIDVNSTTNAGKAANAGTLFEKEAILFKQGYKSTNGSDMIMLLVNVRQL